MNKIKIGKRKWKNRDGTKGKAHLFTYKENNKRVVVQSPNKKWLEKEAEQILFRTGNINPKNMNVDIPVNLIPSWELYEKKCKNKIYEPRINFREVTLKEYRSHYTHILKYCGNVDLTKIDETYIADFKDKLTDNIKDISYRKKIFNTFARIYNIHVGRNKPFNSNLFHSGKYWEDDELKAISHQPKKRKINFDEWDFNRIDTIISNVPNKTYQLMFKLMAETSCRPSEVRAAQRKNFHFKRNIPVFEVTNSVDHKKNLVPPKTEAGYREIEISSSLKDQIIDHMNEIPQDQEFLFLNSVDRFCDLRHMITCLDQALESLNLELPVKRKTYFFRHWSVSYWCYTGKYNNPFDLARHMGDIDLKMIDRVYIKEYGQSLDAPRYFEHQNNNYKWN